MIFSKQTNELNWVLEIKNQKLKAICFEKSKHPKILNYISYPCDNWNFVKWEDFSKSSIHIILSTDDCESAILKAPELASNEILQALSWEMGDANGLNPSEFEFEGFEIPGAQESGLNAQYWWLAAVKKTLIEQILTNCDKAKIKKININVHPLQYRGLFLDNEIDLATGCIFLDSNYATLLFMKKDEILFSKQLDWGTQASEREDFLDRAELDLQRNLDYFDRRLSTVATQKIWLTGPKEENIYHAFKNKLSVPFEIFPLKEKINTLFNITDDQHIQNSTEIIILNNFLTENVSMAGQILCVNNQ